MNHINKLASMVINNVRSGLIGMTATPSLSIEMVEDDIVMTYQNMVKKYIYKNAIPWNDLMISLKCIPVDCKSIDRCRCSESSCSKPMAHFVVPQIFSDAGNEPLINYIGSVNMQRPFLTFTDVLSMNYSVYSRRGSKYPRVWIDTTPNCDNLYDVFIWNAPLIKKITVVAVFKDPRQVDDFICNTCAGEEVECEMTNNMNFMDTEVVQAVTEKYIRYFKQFREEDTVSDLSNKRP